MGKLYTCTILYCTVLGHFTYEFRMNVSFTNNKIPGSTEKLNSHRSVNPFGTQPSKTYFLTSVSESIFHTIEKRLISGLGTQAITDMFLGTQVCFWALLWNGWFSPRIGCKSPTMFRRAPRPEGVKARISTIKGTALFVWEILIFYSKTLRYSIVSDIWDHVIICKDLGLVPRVGRKKLTQTQGDMGVKVWKLGLEVCNRSRRGGWGGSQLNYKTVSKFI